MQEHFFGTFLYAEYFKINNEKMHIIDREGYRSRIFSGKVSRFESRDLLWNY